MQENEGTAGLEFTIKGTDEKGKQITETLKAVDADNAVSVNKFKTITEISTNKASSGKVTIGTTIKDTDYVFEVEEVQFKDGAGKFDIQVEAKDKDKDLKVDEAAFGGSMLGDTLSVSNTSLKLPEWVQNAGKSLGDLFAADNFFEGGKGKDTIAAGAGNDTIDPGATFGDSDDKIDGGQKASGPDTEVDTLILAGKKDNWVLSSSAESGGEFDTYFKYTSKGADGKANIEAVASESSDVIKRW